MLLQPPDPPDPPWARRARVSLAPIPERPPLFRGYRISAFGVIALVLWAIIIATIVWPGR